MSERTYGSFTVNVATGGWPVWCALRYGGQELRFAHTELRDLEYAVKRMLREAEDDLPPNYKHEVAP